MIPALHFLSFFAGLPTRVYEYAAIVAILGGAFGWYTYHERALGAAHELAQVKIAGAKATNLAQASIDKKEADHAAAVATIEKTMAAALGAAATQHASDTDRLRGFDAYRRSHPDAVLQSSACPDSDTGGRTDCITALERRGAELAEAVKHDDALLDACRAERNNLNGK